LLISIPFLNTHISTWKRTIGYICAYWLSWWYISLALYTVTVFPAGDKSNPSWRSVAAMNRHSSDESVALRTVEWLVREHAQVAVPHALPLSPPPVKQIVVLLLVGRARCWNALVSDLVALQTSAD
jgi:hypothetical protein